MALSQLGYAICTCVCYRVAPFDGQHRLYGVSNLLTGMYDFSNAGVLTQGMPFNNIAEDSGVDSWDQMAIHSMPFTSIFGVAVKETEDKTYSPENAVHDFEVYRKFGADRNLAQHRHLGVCPEKQLISSAVGFLKPLVDKKLTTFQHIAGSTHTELDKLNMIYRGKYDQKKRK